MVVQPTCRMDNHIFFYIAKLLSLKKYLLHDMQNHSILIKDYL